MNIEEKTTLMSDYSYRFVGPIMFRYTYWVLKEAKKRGLKRLYFLARDGYLLYETAKKICDRCGIGIECRYLYCSRFSLRMPTYHIIGDEMYELLFLNGYKLTAESLLMRSELNEDERNQIYAELEINNATANLNAHEFAEISEALRNSHVFSQLVTEKSKRSYKSAIAYLRQEGLLDCDTIAVVDSGWTGSMQRSIRQLVTSAGFAGKIVGFYFGMYEQAKELADGEYLTYYFDKNSNTKHKIMFNNNLFECMLSANHPMTKGYAYANETVVPVFSGEYNDEMRNLIQHQINGALSYVDYALDNMPLLDDNKSRKECYTLLKRSMVYPTVQEAELYGSFLFCDDTTESYHISMADKSTKKYLGE